MQSGKQTKLLSDLFSLDRIKVELTSTNKEDLFVELVEFLEESGAITDTDRVLDALKQRESVMSTRVAPHIALPHASMWLFKKTVAVFGISHAGIHYDSEEEEPVHIVMLLIDDRYEANKHLALIQKTARLVGSPNFYGKIMACENAEQVHDLIVEMEKRQQI